MQFEVQTLNPRIHFSYSGSKTTILDTILRNFSLSNFCKILLLQCKVSWRDSEAFMVHIRWIQYMAGTPAAGPLQCLKFKLRNSDSKFRLRSSDSETALFGRIECHPANTSLVAYEEAAELRTASLSSCLKRLRRVDLGTQ